MIRVASITEAIQVAVTCIREAGVTDPLTATTNKQQTSLTLSVTETGEQLLRVQSESDSDIRITPLAERVRGK